MPTVDEPKLNKLEKSNKSNNLVKRDSTRLKTKMEVHGRGGID